LVLESSNATRTYTGGFAVHIHARAARINAADVGDLQAAFDALPPEGGVVHLPAGVYDIDRTVTLALREGQHLLFHGDGRATVVRFEAEDGSPFLDLSGVPDSWWPDLRITLRDLSFMGNHRCGDALRLRWPNDALVDACFFQGFGGTAITVTPQATNVTIRDCWMRDCRRVLHADNLHHLTFHGNQTRSLRGGQTQAEHLYIGRYCREVRIVNNHLAYGDAEGMILDGTAQHVVANNTIEGFTHAIRAVDCRDITINANYLHCATGILGEGDNRGFSITGNLFTDTSQAAIALQHAGDSGGHTITGNIIRQSVYSHGQRGIDLGSARGCVVANNVLEDLSAGPPVAAQRRGASRVEANQLVDNVAHARAAAGLWTPCEAADLGAFTPLYEHLAGLPPECVRTALMFSPLKRLLNGNLPAAAQTEPGWWSNTPRTPQGRAWLAAGWLVAIVRRVEQRVVFARTPPA
jgi:hypothetical protein